MVTTSKKAGEHRKHREGGGRKKPVTPRILTVNGGSSSIKFALFEQGDRGRRIFSGQISGIGLAKGIFAVKDAEGAQRFSKAVVVRDQVAAVKILMEWMEGELGEGALAAVGHRIVHGGPKYWQPQRITEEVIADLHEFSPFDPEHLPGEILLVKAFQQRYPQLPQVACFDTAFHHDLPRVAQLLPIPRRYHAKGVRRYGFHGLSCEYLMHHLEQVAGKRAAHGRVILAHLGNGASVTAVREGKSVDTSMSFTPTAGLTMSSRTGDLDPSLGLYLLRAEHLTAKQFHHMVNHESGLLGISETSPDMRELRARAKKDVRAAEAVAIFCYQTRKWIGALAGALGGLDTLVFAGGIGEHDAATREQICDGLKFLGIRLGRKRNKAGAEVISKKGSGVTVRVIKTDEEWIIARAVGHILEKTKEKK